jgi:uncharacterized delta-60 repeat protein
MAIQNDGKIVVAGRSGNFSSSKFLLVRYNSDGSLDNSFDDDGIVTTALSANADFAFALKIQGDGKLIAAGESVGETSTLDFSLVRYNENGSLDASFGTGGMVFTDFQNSNDQIGSITIQNDGRIVAVGSTGIISEYQKTALARFNTDGSLDAAFGSQGLVTIDASTNDDFARAVAIQSNGNIVVAGEAIVGINNDFALMRFDPNGDLDLSFGDNGFVFTEFNSTLNSARAVAIQNDDKIVAAGMSHPGVADAFAVARYNNVGAIEVPEMERNNANILVYPNPCFAQSTLTSPSSLNGACLSIHNSYGQLVKQSSNLFGKSVVLTRGDLPAGIYTVNLIQANQVVSTVKWVIAD